MRVQLYYYHQLVTYLLQVDEYKWVHWIGTSTEYMVDYGLTYMFWL